MSHQTTNQAPLPLLSAALDDLWVLRAAAAYESTLLHEAYRVPSAPAGAQFILRALADNLDAVAAGRAVHERDVQRVRVEAALVESGAHVPSAAQWQDEARTRENLSLTDATVDSGLLERAAREVWAARELFAAVSHWLGSLSQNYSRLPRRSQLAGAAQRMAAAAVVTPDEAYSGVSTTDLRTALRSAGLPLLLTRGTYEKEQD